jgi:hypothetical protein
VLYLPAPQWGNRTSLLFLTVKCIGMIQKTWCLDTTVVACWPAAAHWRGCPDRGEEAFDTPYGDRRAMIHDSLGNVFPIAPREGK